MKLSRRLLLSGALVSTLSLLTAAAQAQTFYSVSGTLSLNSGATTTRLIGPRTGVAQGTGSGVVPFTLPVDLFQNSGTQALYFPAYPSVAQFLSTFTTSHPAIAVGPAGGPGSFGFCPPVGNPANPACTSPAQATAGFNGLIEYNAGPNQFGGTMQLIRDQRGQVSRRIATGPSQFIHTPRTTLTTWPAGGAMSNTRVVFSPPGVITQSPVLGPSGQIQTPGIYIGPGPTPPTGFVTGQPLTTGQVVLKDSVPSPFSLTLSGYDNRNASGVGTIQLVGGAYIQRPTGTPSQAFPQQTTLTVTLPEPGVATGLVLGALAVAGLGRIRRQQG